MANTVTCVLRCCRTQIYDVFPSLFPRTLQKEYEQLKEQHGQRAAPAGGTWESESPSAHPDEAELLAEAKLLRQHKGRLEARMHILEEHNKQLESQLHRLRQLLHQVTNCNTLADLLDSSLLRADGLWLR